MATTAQKLNQRYKSAKALNNRLAAEILKGKGGATGLTATFFTNANKDLTKISNQVRQAFYNSEISKEEYQYIMDD